MNPNSEEGLPRGSDGSEVSTVAQRVCHRSRAREFRYIEDKVFCIEDKVLGIEDTVPCIEDTEDKVLCTEDTVPCIEDTSILCIDCSS